VLIAAESAGNHRKHRFHRWRSGYLLAAARQSCARRSRRLSRGRALRRLGIAQATSPPWSRSCRPDRRWITVRTSVRDGGVLPLRARFTESYGPSGRPEPGAIRVRQRPDESHDSRGRTVLLGAGLRPGRSTGRLQQSQTPCPTTRIRREACLCSTTSKSPKARQPTATGQASAQPTGGRQRLGSVGRFPSVCGMIFHGGKVVVTTTHPKGGKIPSARFSAVLHARRVHPQPGLQRHDQLPGHGSQFKITYSRWWQQVRSRPLAARQRSDPQRQVILCKRRPPKRDHAVRASGSRASISVQFRWRQTRAS